MPHLKSFPHTDPNLFFTQFDPQVFIRSEFPLIHDRVFHQAKSSPLSLPPAASCTLPPISHQFHSTTFSATDRSTRLKIKSGQASKQKFPPSLNPPSLTHPLTHSINHSITPTPPSSSLHFTSLHSINQSTNSQRRKTPKPLIPKMLTHTLSHRTTKPPQTNPTKSPNSQCQFSSSSNCHSPRQVTSLRG